jgi:hypothetical protein
VLQLNIELYCRIFSTFDLPALQGACSGWRFPGLKLWAESSNPALHAILKRGHISHRAKDDDEDE